MYWADKIAQEIIKSKKYKPYWVDDMKTPSGRVHVGSLRGVVVHDLVYRALKDAGQKVTFTYVIEDHDPMDDVPTYLDKEKWSKFLGQPLFSIPSPDGKASSYGAYFAFEFQEVFNKVGSSPKIIWMSEMYKQGKMNEGIKTCLDHVKTIRAIYEELYEKKMADNWYPFLVLCPQCGKQSTTQVNSWDGKEITFTCSKDAVVWTQGCGYSGKASPFSGEGVYRGKMPWKVEWPVKWKTIGVTIEGGGKDHMSAGGSHDFAKLICERVLNYPVPYPVPHEFFLVGGKKMSSSKGRGSSAKEVSEIIPPYLLRFLIARTNKDQTIDFDPIGWTIPNLFDEYDRAWKSYIDDSDPDLARAFVLSQIDELPSKKPTFLPRFRDIANFYQLPNINIWERLEKIKNSKLTDKEKEIIKERLTYVMVWITNYAPDEYRYQISRQPLTKIAFSKAQWEFLNKLVPIWEITTDPEKLQADLFNLIKSQGINSKDAFKALYKVILDKEYGPRAGWLLKKFPKKVVIERLTLNNKNTIQKKETAVTTFSKPEYFSINKFLKEKYSSVSVGIALINNVTIKKTDAKLEQEKSSLLTTLANLTTEKLGTYPEIISYRKLYKEMGIDWHSRRPSPEALLRRVALKKGLYTVNTCVDAYNLVVMQHRVSVGAFDADTVVFPTTLQCANEGDEILLLGDETPTKYSAKEIAYYDLKGGYNLDFNYRDAKRTMVTEKTKNLWINVDGIFNITPEQVQLTLTETIKNIQKYCGGTVEFFGVVL